MNFQMKGLRYKMKTSLGQGVPLPVYSADGVQLENLGLGVDIIGRVCLMRMVVR